MSQRVVGIAELQVSADPSETLVACSLGSCIGIAIYDPEVRVGGMLHFILPDSSMAPQKAGTKPAMFADTGIPRLFADRVGQGKGNPGYILERGLTGRWDSGR
ncbi:MAG: chemotaxis protein CheD [Thermodesulfobacteriota bacterium]